MLRTVLRDSVGRDGDTKEIGYEEGKVYNLPPHMAKAYVRNGYAEFYHADKKA
jgi:hypothetical protein